MKKFCSACGNQLELSQRFCGECGAVNPFFVPAFTLLSDQKESLEKLRIEKERIEKELAEIEEAQKEFERQEQLRREITDLDKLKAERLEKERLLRETAEREKIEVTLKKEILRVKQELEQHNKQTIDLVREVRNEVKQELHQIEEENKKLKLEVDQLSKQIPERVEQVIVQPVIQPVIPPVVETAPVIIPVVEQVVTPPVIETPLIKPVVTEVVIPVEETPVIPPVVVPIVETPIVTPVAPAVEETPAPHNMPGPEEAKGSSKGLKVVLAVVVAMGAFLVYFYFAHINSQPASGIAAITETKPGETDNANRIVDTMLEAEALAVKTDTVAAEQLNITPAVLTTITRPATPRSASNTEAAAPEKPKSKIALNETKIRHDLNGKKISGCGISIGSEAELTEVSNVVQVEKTPTYIKYKCHVKIVQGSETFTAVPYLYYTAAGAFIKIDGTNCE